jgi:DNA-binding MarR family transcriptional regulator
MDAEASTRLRVVIGRLARDLNASATDEGLTPTQSSALGLIARRGPIGPAEVAELEGLNPTMVSRVFSRLTELDLIERRPDPADLRTINVVITALGRQVQERIRDARAQIISSCMERLPDASLRKLLAALPALEELDAELRTLAASARRR